jgi:hypothetical protein
MTITDCNYWLQRYATAIESAVDAPGDRSRTAYLDLARHYWSMHMMVRGQTLPPPAAGRGNKSNDLVTRWAA